MFMTIVFHLDNLVQNLIRNRTRWV